MKKGYIRLLIYNALIIIFLMTNIFFRNLLTKYHIVIFLTLLIFLFNLFFSVEKNKNEYLKTTLLEILIYLLTFFILFYLLGIIVGFTKTNNYLNLNGFINYLLPIILYIILKEFLRYNMLSKAEGSLITTIVCIITFILLDIHSNLYLLSIETRYQILVFVGITLLPSISNNILNSYLCRKAGYIPPMFISLVMNLYSYLLPIVPSPDYYISSLIFLLFPVFLNYHLYKFFENIDDKELERDNYKINKFIGLGITIIILCICVYFYSGFFRYHAVAIGSGSMTPKIKKGDVVVIDRKYNFKDLKEGEVIAYKKGDLIIVHRIVLKDTLDDNIVYYTRGDANEIIDNITITNDNYYGKVSYMVPYIGLPTVWVNDILE